MVQSGLWIFARLWKTNGLQVTVLGENFFLFRFVDIKERRRVLCTEPWRFDKALLVLAKADGRQRPSELKPDRVSIWVQMHDLPLMCRSRQMLVCLGSKIGNVIDIDEQVDKVGNVEDHDVKSKQAEKSKEGSVDYGRRGTPKWG